MSNRLNSFYNRNNNKWYQQIWLPFAAFTYIIICIFDFVVMPIYVTAHNSRIESVVFQKLEGKDTVTFADTLVKSNQAQRQWNPLTLMGAGMFHLAFGALLTGGAVTRGFAKKSEIESYYRYGMNQPGYLPSNGYGEEYGNSNRYEYEYELRYGNRQRGNGRDYNRYEKNRDYDSGPMPKTRDLDDEK